MNTTEKIRDIEELILRYEILHNTTLEHKDYQSTREMYHNNPSVKNKAVLDNSFEKMRNTNEYIQLSYAYNLKSKLYKQYTKELG